MQKKIRKAIIPAAGLGTRFLPATKAQPKEMLPIVDKPAIQFIVEEAVASGIEEILIVTGRNKRSIEDHFDRNLELEYSLKASGKYDLLSLVQEIADVDFHYIRQKEARGLGHAVLCAKQFVGDEPFAVMLGDDIVDATVPCLKQLIEVYEDCGGFVLGVQEVPKRQVSRYGVVKPQMVKERLWKALDLVEKPAVEEAPSRLAVLGRYVIEPEIFEILAATPPGAGGEIQLTDAIDTLNKTQRVFAREFKGNRYDVGDKFGFIKTSIDYALQHPQVKDDLKQYLIELGKQLDKPKK